MPNKAAIAIVLLFLLMPALVVVLVGCGNDAPDSLWAGANESPISTVYEIAIDDIAEVYYRNSKYLDSRPFFQSRDERVYMINMLRKLELLEDANDFDEDGAINYVYYEIQLKGADPVALHFYDGVVDTGKGRYYYKSADSAVAPDNIRGISISPPLYYGGNGGDYDDPDDIKSLRTFLEASGEGAAPAKYISEISDYMSVRVEYFGEGMDNIISLYIAEEGGTYYLYRYFINTCFYLWEISPESYEHLAFASKRQFGRLLHFTITSGGKTICPQGYFISATDGKSGAHADGFPSLDRAAGMLESVVYGQDFSIWAKDERATVELFLPDTYTPITIEGLGDLQPGEYVVACYLTIMSEYEEGDVSEGYKTDVYWFKLLVAESG
ncbi:MAG: hypothetical protein FWH01_00420 [Oscillospiraceae bacterium]|nr:hypothetical protein [Oscillospiraceae bacterium]